MQTQFKWLFSLLWITVQVQADSLWTQARPNSWFSDICAKNKGDIVLLVFPDDVMIEAEIEGGDKTSVHPNAKYPFIKKVLDRFLQKTQYTLPEPYHSPATTYPKTDIAMQIMDVLPNGNMVIEGIRKYKFWDTYKFESIRGIIRSSDIGSDNSVPMEKVSHLTIDYATGNSFEDAKRNGLITNLNNFFDPY